MKLCLLQIQIIKQLHTVWVKKACMQSRFEPRQNLRLTEFQNVLYKINQSATADVQRILSEYSITTFFPNTSQTVKVDISVKNKTVFISHRSTSMSEMDTHGA